MGSDASHFSEARPRAARLAPEERRSSLVTCAASLFVDLGPSFTTAELAEAAGVSEGTIFRYFPDKEAILGACRRELLGIDSLLPQLEAAAALPTLEARLTQAAEIMEDHLLRASGVIEQMKSKQSHGPPPVELLDELMEAIGQLFAGHSAEMRYPRRKLARLFVGLALSNAMLSSATRSDPLPPRLLVDVLLRGTRR